MEMGECEKRRVCISEAVMDWKKKQEQSDGAALYQEFMSTLYTIVDVDKSWA
jgi:hypothetical protein